MLEATLQQSNPITAFLKINYTKWHAKITIDNIGFEQKLKQQNVIEQTNLLANCEYGVSAESFSRCSSALVRTE